MPNNITLSSPKHVHDDAMKTISSPGTYYQHARPEVLDLVPLTARRVLDVGCGAGDFSASLKARQSVEIHGVEFVTQAAELARSHLDQVWNNTIEEILPSLPDAYYDCIVIADVLEHLLDPWTVLTSLKGKLATSGRIVSSIPNVQNWNILADLLQGRWDYQNEGILDRTHLRFFTRKSVEELFWSAGFRITTFTATAYGSLPPPKLLKVLAKIGLSTKELEQDGQAYQFLIEAEVPKQAITPKVTVIILNWNGKEDTLECLASISQLDYPNHEIVVVDNGSTDDSVDVISKQYPDITLLQTGANLGYAGGNNVGIRWALDHDADFIFLLNNDTIVSLDLLSTLVRVKNLLPANSVLGAKIFFYDKPDTLWFAGGRWNSKSNSFKHIGHGQTDTTEFKHVTEVDYITGCALFASAETFRETGLLDENFFLTYEETDWCYRARAKGHKCIFVPEAKLWHKVSVSFGGVESPLQLYFYTRNILLWGEQHLSRADYWKLFRKTFKNVMPFSIGDHHSRGILKPLFWTISSVLRRIQANSNDPIARAKYLGLRDYLLRRFGDCPQEVRSLKLRR